MSDQSEQDYSASVATQAAQRQIYNWGAGFGWHCHSVCGKIADIRVGPTRPPGSVRLPKVGAHHRKMNIVFNEREALEKAFSFYRVESGTPGTLL